MTNLPADAYRDDLAYIHDAGFGGFATQAAPFVLKLLEDGDIRRGQVVELGCGSGIVAAALTRAGYNVLGFDSVTSAMTRKGVYLRLDLVLDEQFKTLNPGEGRK